MPDHFLTTLINARKYAEAAQIMIEGMPRLRAIWADAIEARTEAHPFVVQAYARWAGWFNK